MLEINQLTYSYDGATNVLDKVTFKLEKCKIYCLLGINGSGKTTLFNCLTGFLKGNVTLDEEVINEKILYIQDKMSFYNNLTGIEFIKLIFNLKKKKLEEEELNELLENLKMKKMVNELISTYSLGTRQKLVLIVGFLMKYECIFMDEPFAAIDFIAAEVIMDFLRDYRDKNNTIVVSTHQIDLAQEIADEILFLNNGKVYAIKNDFNNSNEIKKWIKDKIGSRI
jgi:ABC-2 type transport system ATP-binding protein